MIRLVTVATHNEGYMSWLIKSCKRHNVKLNVLGWGKKWKNFTQKFELIMDFLNECNDNDLICFIDAYDVILLRPIDELEQIYNKIDKDIIISSENVNETVDFFWGKLRDDYFSLCKNNRINSGLYISKACKLKEILKEILLNYNVLNNNNDDQKMITKHCENNKNMYHIDTNNEIFLTIFNPMFNEKNNKIKIIDQKLFYENNQPFFIHGNGNTRLDDIILKLEYDMDNKSITDTIIHNVKTVLIKKFPAYSYLYLRPYLFDIMLIIIILALIYYTRE
jgi:hypothetical protein